MPVSTRICGALAVCLAAAASAQTAGSDQGSAPPASTGWNMGLFEIHGTVDSYYSVGLNGSGDRMNVLRAFDVLSGQLDLNMAKVTLEHAAAPIGFQVDLGVGRMFDVPGASETKVSVLRYVEQAFVSVKPEDWHGMQLDVGKFATSAGAEVIDTRDNWNYSRSLLFTLAIPFYHTGMRATVPIDSQFSAGVQWVSGWNNVITGATYKTVGVTTAWTGPKFSWNNTYYGGPDENAVNRGMRSLYDSTLNLTLGAKVKAYLNYDYGHDKPRAGPGYQWTGIAGAATYRAGKRFAISPRAELFRDDSGKITGAAQTIEELTLTGTYSVWHGISNYIEIRKDWSAVPCLGNCGPGKLWSNQPTLVIGMAVRIGPGG